LHRESIIAKRDINLTWKISTCENPAVKRKWKILDIRKFETIKTKQAHQSNLKYLAPVLAPEYMPPASPYPGYFIEDERWSEKKYSKGFDKDQQEELIHKYISNKEHTCEDRPFCSVGRFGFVKSLWSMRSKLSISML